MEALLTADTTQRARARTLVRHLCNTPGRAGDYRAVDKNGQMWEVGLVDGVTVTYRPDDAVRELRIATIDWVD